jgi:hypothetical protein
MATLTIPNSYAPGEVIEAAEMNANFTAVKNFAEGLSTGANFDAGAINTEDIAAAAITEAKIATGAVTSSKIQTSVSLTTPILGVATGTSLNLTGNVIAHAAPTPIVGAYTLQLTDDGTIIEKNDASGVTVTIPLNSSVAFPIGTQIVLIQTNTGQTTIAGAGGVTVNGTPGLKLRTQFSSCVCLKRGTDTWVLLGDLAA